MLSRKNLKARMNKLNVKQERFSIRKLSVGTASVLIGLTFMGVNAQDVKADTLEENTNTAETAPTSNLDNDKELYFVENSAINQLEDNSQTQAVENATQQGEVPNNENAANNTSSASQAESVTPPVETTSNSAVVNDTSNVSDNETVDVAQPPASPVQEINQEVEVSDWAGLVGALNNVNVSTIKIIDWIQVTGLVDGLKWENGDETTGNLILTGENIARKLTIEFIGMSNLKFMQYSLLFDNLNQSNGSAWDIIIKNAQITGSMEELGSKTAILSFKNVSKENQQKNTITISNSAIEVTGRPILAGGNNGQSYFTLNFAGDKSEGFGFSGLQVRFEEGEDVDYSAFEAGVVNVLSGRVQIQGHGHNPDAVFNKIGTGGNFFYVTQPDQVDEDGNLKPSMTIAPDAELILYGNQKDIGGIYIHDGISGTLKVEGFVTAGIGTGAEESNAAGSSTAILAGNLDITSTGAVSIFTNQDEAAGVIAIGVGNSENPASAATNTINIDGKLLIKRPSTAKTDTKLIVMGNKNGNSQLVFNINQGAAVDLQDAANSGELISLIGENNSGKLVVDQPAYLNIQRTGQTTGNLLHTDAATNTDLIINGNLMLAQWDENNTDTTPTYAWSIANATSTNPNADKFFSANGSVTLGPNQAGKDSFKFENNAIVSGTPESGEYVNYETPYLNQFLNNFNFSTPQRLTFGTQLYDNSNVMLYPDFDIKIEKNITINDAQKDQPKTEAINGEIGSTLDSFDPKEGISSIINQNYATSADNLDDLKVNWYNSATDKEEYLKQFGANSSEPTNPTGAINENTSAVATVTYPDGSVDFVVIPLKVKEYVPTGGNITVDLNHELTADDAKDAITNAAELPDGTTYAWKEKPSTTSAGENKAGIVTVSFPDGSSKDVDVQVTVKPGSVDPVEPDKPTPQGTIILNYRDENGNIINTVTISGDQGTSLNPSETIKSNIPEGYQLKDGYEIPTNVAVGTELDIQLVKIGESIPSQPTLPDNGDGDSSNNESNTNPDNPTNSEKVPTSSSVQNNTVLTTVAPKATTQNLAAVGQNSTSSDENKQVSGVVLPQTGRTQSLAGIIGALVSGIGLLLGLGLKKKKE